MGFGNFFFLRGECRSGFFGFFEGFVDEFISGKDCWYFFKWVFYGFILMYFLWEKSFWLGLKRCLIWKYILDLVWGWVFCF